MAQMREQLEKCTTPDDQDVVKGLVAFLLSGLPEDFTDEKHEDTLRANGLCRVRVLRKLTEAKLEALGLSMGDAMMLVEALQEEKGAPAELLAGAAMVAAGAPQARRPEMRPFPKCGPTRYPELEEWEPFKTGLRLRVQPEMTAAGQAALLNVVAGGDVPGGWAAGCPDDVVIITELVNGPGAMPDETLRLVPKAFRDANAGLQVLHHLNSRVCAVSEAATEVQEEEFGNQRPVAEAKKHMLASVLAGWRQLRDVLAEKGAQQSAARQRRSLNKMVAKLPEVLNRLEASVAAHKVMQPGTELPVATIEVVLEEFASKYSSVAAVEGAYGLQLMEAFEVVPIPRQQQQNQHWQGGNSSGSGAPAEGREKIPCKFWKLGNCWRQQKCPWRHDGKPGPGKGAAPAPAAPAPAWMAEQMDLWLANKVAGVSVLLGVGQEKARGMILAALQVAQHHHRASDCLGQHPGVALMVVADTGATVRVIGGADSSRAQNVRALPRPVRVSAAGGETLVHEIGDLPGYGGLMEGCLIMEGCAHSLLPVGSVCAEKGWSYQIDEGNTGSRFTKGGETIVQLESMGTMAVVPQEVALPVPRSKLAPGSTPGSTPEVAQVALPGPGVAERASRVPQLEVAGVRGTWEHMWGVPEVEVQQLEIAGGAPCNSFDSNSQNACNSLASNNRNSCNSLASNNQLEVDIRVRQQMLHALMVAQSEGTVGVSAYGLESYKSVEPGWMRQHELDGHPYDKRCPWCVQARLRQKQHLRQQPGSGTELAGSTVKVDLTGPYDPGVTGSTWALVGVHEESDWGFVGLQKSKSAPENLVSIQSLEVQLRADSGGRAEPIARFHHDDDKGFRGPVEVHARQQGWKDTHTGGYNPNANAKAEVRIGMLKQRVRVLLLACTGGTLYYEQLWDVALVHSNRLLNRVKWPDRDSPIARLLGVPVPRDKYNHVFGSYCLYHIPKENRSGAFQPASEMGVWVGNDPHVVGGHWVVPITWDVEQQSWILGQVVTATTVRVYERVKPLRMQPKKGQYGSQEFDTFVDKVFNPMLRVTEQPEGAEAEEAEAEVQQPESAGTEVQQPEEAGAGPEFSEIESVLDKRVRGGVVQYKVKWKGWNNRYNCWRDQSDLECTELIDKYEEAYLSLSQPEAMQCVLALVLSLATAGAVADDRVQEAVEVQLESLHRQMLGLDSVEAVRRLMVKQQLGGCAQDFVPSYEKELQHMIDRRLRVLSPEEEVRVRANSPVVSMRMLLGVKKDGRKKARLVLQGFKEPKEWDTGSNVSPVAYPSSVKSLVFMGGESGDVLSSIDISVAFLQSEEYGPDETPRYVSYRPFAGAREYVFQLRGPVYGQRSAPRAWYATVTQWLVQEMGYEQGKNEPCLFVHPETQHRIVLFSDDFLCRGSREVSEKFYAALAERFECKDPSWLSVGSPLIFTGMDISEVAGAEGTMYRMDQARDLRDFLTVKGLESEALKENPIGNKSLLADSEEICENLQAWCRSVIGGLHYFARGTRYDISYAVSRVSQTMVSPTKGTVRALEQLAGYLISTLDDSALEGKKNPGVDVVINMCDASHRGDNMSSRSQTGVIICLNGVPIMWRSNRQPVTSLSPAESEIYALSVGVRDARLMGWVLEELGVEVRWPIKI